MPLAYIDKQKVEQTYNAVMEFLLNTQDVRVLIVVDEVNLLWTERYSYFSEPP